MLSSNLALFVPIAVIFWMNNGLSFTMIMILQSLFSVAVVLLEVPTGYFADVHGRKLSLLYGAVACAGGMIAYSFGFNFFQFLLGELLLAVGVAFVSGANSALVYDTLVDLKREEDYKKIWGNTVFYRLISMSVFSLLSGYIAEVNMRYTLYVPAIIFLIMIPIIATLKEPNHHKIVLKKHYLVELKNILITSILKKEKLKWIILYSALIFTFTQIALWFYQPYFELSGIKLVYFGYIFASFNIVAALSSKYSHKIEKRIGQKLSLVSLVLIVGIGYLLMGNLIFLFSFVFCFSQQFTRGFYEVVITDYINKLTDSNVRATVLSAQSFLGRLVYAITIPFIGLLTDKTSIVFSLNFLGISTLLIGGLLLLKLHKSKIL